MVDKRTLDECLSGISFPASAHAETVAYRVNNVFWRQEYGGLA